jgi:hypothetical protein
LSPQHLRIFILFSYFFHLLKKLFKQKNCLNKKIV